MPTIRVHGQRVPDELKAIDLKPWEGELESLLRNAIELKPGLAALVMSEGKVRTDLGILVNGRHCMFIDGLKTFISGRDIVDILLPVIGG